MILSLRRRVADRLPHRGRFYQDFLFRRLSEKRLGRLLTQLGVREGMLVYVQAAFGSLGYYRKGPQAFIELLRRLVGPTGTIAMPSFPFSGSMAGYVETRPVFHVTKTPSRSGLLTETMRRVPGAKRSLHPTHPICAVGARAAELVEGHDRCSTPQGGGSPFARLVEWGAYVLRIGASAYPLCHHLQELVDYPNLFLPGSVSLECVDERGRTSAVETRVYRPRLPYVLNMDDRAGQQPVPMNILDFPLLFETRDRHLRDEAGKRFALGRLIEIREEFASHDELRFGSVNGCSCDFFPLSSSFSFAAREVKELIKRHRSQYEASHLERGFEQGAIRL